MEFSNSYINITKEEQELLQAKAIDWLIRDREMPNRKMVPLFDSQTGQHVGFARVRACYLLDTVDYRYNRKHHKQKGDVLPYENTYAWVLK